MLARRSNRLHLIFDSGSRKQYRNDIRRTMAMPFGAQLQLRFRQEHIRREIYAALQNRVVGEECLLLHVYGHDVRHPTLVPLRFARIGHSEAHGSSVSVMLTLLDFAYAPDLTGFAKRLMGSKIARIPDWLRGEGEFWSEITAEYREAGASQIERTRDLKAWENIVLQLWRSPLFTHENYFYVVDSIQRYARPWERRATRVHYDMDGRLELAPRTDYSIRIYHFSPANVLPDGYFAEGDSIWLGNTSPWLQFITNTQLHVDSPYDRKQVRFRTGSPPEQVFDRISVSRGETGETQAWDFDMEVTIRDDRRRLVSYALLVGIALWVPQLVTMLRNNDLHPRWLWIVVALACYLVVGVVGAFGLKKVV